MNANTVLHVLSRLGARVEVSGDNLKVQAPKGALTPDLKAALMQRKPELLDLLQRQSAVQVAAPLSLIGRVRAVMQARGYHYEAGNVSPCVQCGLSTTWLAPDGRHRCNECVPEAAAIHAQAFRVSVRCLAGELDYPALKVNGDLLRNKTAW